MGSEIQNLVRANGCVVEKIRGAYVAMPWTTASGLARRFLVSDANAIAAIMGGWRGASGLSFNVRAKNLARARAENAEDLRAKFCRSGPVTMEPDLERGSASAAIARRAKRSNQSQESRRRRKFKKHVATYEPLVGASARSGQRARRGAKS